LTGVRKGRQIDKDSEGVKEDKTAGDAESGEDGPDDEDDEEAPCIEDEEEDEEKDDTAKKECHRDGNGKEVEGEEKGDCATHPYAVLAGAGEESG